MIITALAPWYGSKRILAPEVLRQLGRHSSYWEPFCGSMAVLLAKEPSPHETANDLHGDLTNLARVLRDEGLAVVLYSRLSRTLASEALFRECRDWWLTRPEVAGDEPDADRAYRYFVVSWLGRNGISGTERYNHSYSVCWKKAGGNRATRFASAVESIPDWHQRLRRVVMLRRCGLEVLGKIEDQAGTAVYVDPPYLLGTRAKTGGGGLYQHDMTGEQHALLAALLRRFRKARVVLSGYDCPALDALYPGWGKVLPEAGHVRLSVGVRNRTADVRHAVEVLLVNGDPAAPTRAPVPTLFDDRKDT